MGHNGDRAVTRRNLLASLGALSASLAGCASNQAGSQTTAATTTSNTMEYTGPATAVTTYETTALRIPSPHDGFVAVFDRLLVGDNLGGQSAADGHKWVLAPVYIETDQTDNPDVDLPALSRYRLAGYMGDDERTQPYGYVVESRDESRPPYKLSSTVSVRHYPVDGVPDALNDPDSLAFPKYGIAFHAPENAGYEFQIIRENGFPIMSMVAKPPEGQQ